MGMLRRDPLLSLDNAGTPRGVRHEVNYALRRPRDKTAASDADLVRGSQEAWE